MRNLEKGKEFWNIPMGQNPCKQEKWESGEGKMKWKEYKLSQGGSPGLRMWVSQWGWRRWSPGVFQDPQREAAPPSSWLYPGEVGFDLLASRIRKGYIYVALSHRVCSNLFHQDKKRMDQRYLCSRGSAYQAIQPNGMYFSSLHVMATGQQKHKWKALGQTLPIF